MPQNMLASNKEKRTFADNSKYVANSYLQRVYNKQNRNNTISKTQ